MYGEVFGAALKGIIGAAAIAGLIVGAFVSLAIVGIFFLFFRPTEASIEREKNRQAVIETLTKEQREALGL